MRISKRVEQEKAAALEASLFFCYNSGVTTEKNSKAIKGTEAQKGGEGLMKESFYTIPGCPTDIALLSDLHGYSPYPVIESLKRRRPSLIAITGDILYGNLPEDNVSPLLTQTNVLPFLKACAELAPSYLSLGNHELYLDREDLDLIASTKVRLLDNSWITENGLVVGGLSSAYVTDYRLFRSSISEIPGAAQERYPSRRDHDNNYCDRGKLTGLCKNVFIGRSTKDSGGLNENSVTGSKVKNSGDRSENKVTGSKVKSSGGCSENSITEKGIGNSTVDSPQRIPETAWLTEYSLQPGYHILLSHHPEYIRYIPPNIELVLSGHAHGGQWRFFGHGLFAPGQGILPRWTKGIYDGRLVVSAGLSNTAPVPRLFNPTEIVYIRGIE